MEKSQKITSRQDISERLVYFREKVVSLTQGAFASQLALSKRTLQTYEYAQVGIPVEFCRRAYDTFGLDPLWLMTGHGAPETKIGREWARPMIQLAYESVTEAIKQSGVEVTEAQKGWLVQAFHEHLVKANGNVEKVDFFSIMRLRPA